MNGVQNCLNGESYIVTHATPSPNACCSKPPVGYKKVGNENQMNGFRYLLFAICRSTFLPFTI